MPERIQVAPLREFAELGNSRMLIKHNRRCIAVFYNNGAFYAVDNACYHHGGPLLYGDIEDLGGHPCVVCPWHEYKIALDSGECLYLSIDPKSLMTKEHTKSAIESIRSKGRKQRVHTVIVENEMVYVSLNESEEQFESDSYLKVEVANKYEAMQHPVCASAIVQRKDAQGLKLHSNYNNVNTNAEGKYINQKKVISLSNAKNAVVDANKDSFAQSEDTELRQHTNSEQRKSFEYLFNNELYNINSNDNDNNIMEKHLTTPPENREIDFTIRFRPTSSNPLLPPSLLHKSWPCERHCTELLHRSLYDQISDDVSLSDGCTYNDIANNTEINYHELNNDTAKTQVSSIRGHNNSTNKLSKEKKCWNNSSSSINSVEFANTVSKSTSELYFSSYINNNNDNNYIRKNKELYVSCFRMEQLGLNIKALYFKLVKGIINCLPQLGEFVEIELPNCESKLIHTPIRRWYCITDITSYSCFFSICLRYVKNKNATSNDTTFLYDEGLHKIVKVKQFMNMFTMDAHQHRIRQVGGQVLWLTCEMGITTSYAGIKSCFDDTIFVNSKHEPLHILHLHVDEYAQDIPFLNDFVRWRNQFNNLNAEKYNKSLSFVLFLTEQEAPLSGDSVKWEQAALYRRQLNTADVRRAL